MDAQVLICKARSTLILGVNKICIVKRDEYIAVVLMPYILDKSLYLRMRFLNYLIL